MGVVLRTANPLSKLNGLARKITWLLPSVAAECSHSHSAVNLIDCEMLRSDHSML